METEARLSHESLQSATLSTREALLLSFTSASIPRRGSIRIMDDNGDMLDDASRRRDLRAKRYSMMPMTTIPQRQTLRRFRTVNKDSDKEASSSLDSLSVRYPIKRGETEMSRSQASLKQSMQLDQGNVFIQSSLSSRVSMLSDNSIPRYAQTMVTSYESRDTIQPRQPRTNGDHTLMFPGDIGNEEGTFIFRIEALTPTLVETDFLFTSDAYIILKVDNLTKQVVTWIGDDAETDKRFCVAIYAVALRNLCESTSKIIRLTQADEGIEEYGDFEVTEGGTTSSLFKIEKRTYKQKLYRVEDRLKLTDRITPKDVYLFDAGDFLYLYYGKESSLNKRSKGRIIMLRIANGRKDAYYEEFEGGVDDSEFLAMIEPFQADECQDERVELYRVFPKSAPDLDDHIVARNKISRKMLVADGCYILDSGTEVSLWIGSKSWPALRSVAIETLANIVQRRNRVSWMALNREVDGTESEVFKTQFYDWQTGAKKDKKEIAALNTEGLNEMVLIHPNFVGIQQKMSAVNSCLVALTSFVYTKGTFGKLPDKERGHFFKRDAYLFLCVYKGSHAQLETILSSSSLAVDLPEFEEGEEEKTACVVYFSQSHRTGKVPYSHFKLTTQKEMEDLVFEMYNCSVTVKLVEYGVEPFAFLAHLDNKYTLNEGSRRDISTEKKMYQIRVDAYDTMRAVNVDLQAPCVSLDTYFGLNVDGRSTLCFSAGIKKEQKEVVLSLVSGLVNLSAEEEEFTSSEELELERISSYLKKLDIVAGLEDFADFLGKEVSLLSISSTPIFFDCNTLSGFFQTTHIPQFTQTNLHPSSCIILDPGTDRDLYLWIGSEVSDLVLMNSRKCAREWLNHCKDGRQKSRSSSILSLLGSFVNLGSPKRDYICEVLEGHESNELKSYFHGWDYTLRKVVEPGNHFLREGSLIADSL